jgi:hypothetical protein
VVDLGCGAGSNLRALAPLLPSRQDWLLVDHDPALLDTARERIARWADEAEVEGHALRALKEGRRLTIRFRRADLARELESVLSGPADLVTAAALFDLVSEPWIGRFAAAVAAREAAFATFLTYDGRETWTPRHPADGEMLAAFHGHQGGDKGFGPAAGPGATALLERAFRGRGYRVLAGDSAWRLVPVSDAALLAALAEGSAQAVRETGEVPEETISDWLEARRSDAACTVGHMDLIALPGV